MTKEEVALMNRLAAIAELKLTGYEVDALRALVTRRHADAQTTALRTLKRKGLVDETFHIFELTDRGREACLDLFGPNPEPVL